MPELAEVETVVRAIAPQLTGRTLLSVSAFIPKLRYPIPKGLVKLNKVIITGVKRRAKFILIALDNHDTILIHLGMTGVIAMHNHQPEQTKHQHLLFTLDDGSFLTLTDPRRFGWVNLVPTPALSESRELKNMGPEPLGNDFNANYLYQQTRKRNTSIKQLIMNNAVVVGVGNIYASESLFLAGISPLRPAGKLTKPESAALVSAIKTILTKAIAAGGTTIRDFQHSEGRLGYFQHHLQVYGREGQPCRKCDGIIVKIRQNGRSTFYCPSCQK